MESHEGHGGVGMVWLWELVVHQTGREETTQI